MDHIIAQYQSYRALLLPTLFGCVTLLILWLHRNRRLDTIPGPKTYPLIGVGYKLPRKPRPSSASGPKSMAKSSKSASVGITGW